MLEPPTDLSTDSLRDCLRREYGLAIDTVTFLPLGHDLAAWVFRADAPERSYFVKLRRKLANLAGLAVPRHLAHNGMRDVVAPLPGVAGQMFDRVGSYFVIVYPFVSTTTGMSHGMSDGQWREYGRALREVHEATLPADVASLLRADQFQADGLAQVRRVDAHVVGRHFDQPGPSRSAGFWQTKRATIFELVETVRDLGRELASNPPPFVLCHADIHTNNVLVGEHDAIWLVDWDETMLAPRERDLMFVIGGIARRLVSPDQERLFFEGYGEVVVDRVALAYYRYNWALADIGAYSEQVFLRPDLGRQDLDEAAQRFESLFAPGSIVDIAMASQYR